MTKRPITAVATGVTTGRQCPSGEARGSTCEVAAAPPDSVAPRDGKDARTACNEGQHIMKNKTLTSITFKIDVLYKVTK